MTPVFNPCKFKLSQASWASAFVLSLLSTLITAFPLKAAEEIDFVYPPARISISVNALETFAKTGEVNDQLSAYLDLVKATEAEKAKFREALTRPTKVDAALVSHFFNSAMGEEMLTRMGEYISVQRGGNGKSALKTAFIKAASDPQGLTLLNFLNDLPTNMQVDVQRLLALRNALQRVIEITRIFHDEVIDLSATATQAEPIDFSAKPDLRQPGSYQVQKPQRLNLKDTRRNRELYVDLYQPQRWRTGKTPVVIISHGLGSDPADFAARATHLASYGYFVAVPQHPGSDGVYKAGFLAGQHPDIFDSQEFINRPKDISFVLDELERLNNSEFEGRLDLKRVGVHGHSFGGYTALAVGGAEIDLGYLKQQCEQEFSYLNTSLLLQCRALTLPNLPTQFRDPRVQAVMATNPVNRSIFGEEGLGAISIPVLLGSGLYDPAAPAIFEQAVSFIWLKTPQKYLVLVEGQAHINISQLDAGITQTFSVLEKISFASPELIDRYANSGIVAFFEVNIANNPEFKPYLSSAYFSYLSTEEPFKSYLINSSATEALRQEWIKLKQQK